MTKFRIRFLNKRDIASLIELYTTVFDSLDIVENVPEEQLEYKINTEGIDLGLSIGIYAKKNLIGFILHTNNNGRLFNRLTCILRDYKDSVLISKMYAYAIPIFRSFNISKINVIVNFNHDLAIKEYRKIGFKKWRTNESFSGLLSQSQTSKLESLMIEPTNYYEYLLLFAEKNVIPSLDNNEFIVSSQSDHIIIHKAILDNISIGYIVYDKITSKILQVFVKENYRRQQVATHLVLSLVNNGASFRITHVDNQYYPLIQFIKKLGGTRYHHGVEMELRL